MPFNLLLIEYHVEDAKTAPGQDRFQINSELNVLIDHLLFAMIALPDNLLTDTPVSNAQLDKFNHKLMLRHAILQLVPDNTRLELKLTTSTVEDVRLANGHNTCQILKEPNACLDHLLTAQAALPDNLMMDTHVLTAQ